jgi:AcrR family transcriptional regulator
MVRITKDPDERRTEFLDTALRLFEEQGYDNVAVQHITDAMEVAKGTFYHYFESKEALLAELTEREVHHMHVVAELAAGTAKRPAIDRLRDAVGTFQSWEPDDLEVLIPYLRVLFRDENAIWRERVPGTMLDTMLPMLADLMSEGMRQGVFEIDDPETAAEVTIAIWHGMYEKVNRPLVELREHPEFLSEVMRRLRAVEVAVERTLGIDRDALRLYDFDAIERALRDVVNDTES